VIAGFAAITLIEGGDEKATDKCAQATTVERTLR
jgi:hypothetical protein